jgi:hypothetical protein
VPPKQRIWKKGISPGGRCHFQASYAVGLGNEVGGMSAREKLNTIPHKIYSTNSFTILAVLQLYTFAYVSKQKRKK